MGAEFHILAPCPHCGTEVTLTHAIADGAVLTAPPVMFVQCGNVHCNKKYKVTLRVECEPIARDARPPEYGPLRIAP